MSSFGFGKPAEKREKTIDKAGLPRGPIVVDPASERDAVARGEQLGYVDRGQTDTQPSGAAGRGGRKRPPAPPSQTLYIRAPQELAEWFERYTEQRGHRALWNSIEDFRKLPPDIVLVDNVRNDWGAWVRADAELSELLKPYSLVRSVDGVDVLLRKP